MPTPSARRRRTGRACLGIAAAAAIVLTSISGTLSASAADSRSYPSAKPSWARSANDAGAATGGETIEGELAFALKDASGAADLARAVSDPRSRSYRRYVQPADWIARFAPDADQYAAVVDYLRSTGLEISATPKSRLFIVFRGTADQLSQAFDTPMRRYRHDGRVLVAPASIPSLPDRVASAVSAVHIGDAAAVRRPDSIRQSDAVPASTARRAAPARIPAPCSEYYGQHTVKLPKAYGRTVFPTALCGYTGSQFRAAYGVSRKATGAGQTVAIVDAYASPTIVSDVNTLAYDHGEPALRTYSQIAPPFTNDQDVCEGAAGWQGEQTLDVVAVHSMATKARILYVGGFNCNGGIDAALSTILDDRLATIVTNSYGWIGDEVPAGYYEAEENQHLQAVAEGVGLYYSSGDDGDVAAETATPQASFEASSPWVTAVGGTTLGIKRNGAVGLETGWGSAVDPVAQDDATGALSYGEPLPGEFAGGAGGGRSTQFAEPWYQRGVVPSSLAQGRRVNSDVSADADPFTGELIGVSPITDEATLETGDYEEDTYGGTSLASPLFAGQMALVQQAIGGKAVGFANPVIYAAYRSHRSTFRDVKPNPTSAFAYTSVISGSTFLITNDRDTSLRTRKAFDEPTGLGALRLGSLKAFAKR